MDMPDGQEVVPHTWSESDRFLPKVFVRPAQRFAHVEASSAIVMLGAAAVALIWANSAWSSAYRDVWGTHLGLSAGGKEIFNLTLRDWFNDGAMSLFFLVVALEIKREFVSGELRDRRAAALPVLAALGGMLLPAGIYLVVTFGTGAAHGWGVPMATDIAFAVAIVALAGNRVPVGAKLLLLTLAIADDLGAIVVIGIFYTDDLRWFWLAAATAAVLLALMLRRLDVRSLAPYVLLGTTCWACLHHSGVHSTLAGVAFGMLAPAWSFYAPARFAARAAAIARDVDAAFSDGKYVVSEYQRTQDSLRDMRRLAKETAAPLDRLSRGLTPWVSFVVVPLFALANAGVPLQGITVDALWSDRVLVGVGLGLVLGKMLGVYSAVWFCVRFLGLPLPVNMSRQHLLGVSACAGVGFTVAMFMTELAFTDKALADSAKAGVLLGSAVAGVLGYIILRTSPIMNSEASAAPEAPA